MPPMIRASATSTASHTGKPVNGRVEPATCVTVPRTPWFAGFGEVSVLLAPSTPPVDLVDGDADCVPAT